MEILLGVLLIGLVGAFVYVSLNKAKFDTNQDGKLDADEAKSAATAVVTSIGTSASSALGATMAVADVNKDGKVDKEDVKEVVKRGRKKASEATQKVATKAKSVATKAKTAATNARGRKPASKKS